ncbi:hypothetical protein QJS10_CPA16g00738 [Acorus calamus]|uniref:Uncharacterized protein n=1 Tax=Acorus calamus TaxID=4465 RepID=A0AAV9CZW4_ACOCL|nr:hypothetical protein QJS10_CPA16g00738 [Acorus calamus]
MRQGCCDALQPSQKDITLDQDGPLDNVQRRLHKYCNSGVNRWRANIIRVYLKGLWALLILYRGVIPIGAYHHPDRLHHPSFS